MEDDHTRVTADQISIFISFKEQDAEIAEQIKRIIQQHGRIEIHVFKETEGGVEYRDWIKSCLQRSHLFLLIYTDLTADWTWCMYEAGLFTPLNGAPERPLICLHPPHILPPAPLSHYEAVKAEPADLVTRLLRPLYLETPNLIPAATHPVNDYLTDETMQNIAEELTRLMETKGLEPEYYDETIKITINDPTVLQGEEANIPEDTPIEVVGHRRQLDLLGIQNRTFTWAELREQAKLDSGADASWINELTQALKTAATGNHPGVMTSTFRHIRGGRIYRPNLFRVDKVNGQPLIYYLLFNEELAPELLPLDNTPGKLFNLLRLENRVRAEIIDPFLTKIEQLPVGIGAEGEHARLCQQVKERLDAIDLEADRHDLFGQHLMESVFSGKDRDDAKSLRTERVDLHGEIMTAIRLTNTQRLKYFLEKRRDVNHKLMALTARVYSQAVAEDN